MSSLGMILQESRNNAHMSQEEASLRSSYSVSMIARYEADRIRAPWQAIRILADVYQDHGLIHRAIQECEPWNDLFPRYKPKPLPVSAINLIHIRKRVSDDTENLIDILADGVVSPEEQPAMQVIHQNIIAEMVACLQMLDAEVSSAEREMKNSDKVS